MLAPRINFRSESSIMFLCLASTPDLVRFGKVLGQYRAGRSYMMARRVRIAALHPQMICSAVCIRENQIPSDDFFFFFLYGLCIPAGVATSVQIKLKLV